MERTRRRPLPLGRVAPEEALTFGVVLASGSVFLMGIAVNWTAAALLALTVLFYVFVYTIWLKRRTPQNIVIGGAAGAFPRSEEHTSELQSLMRISYAVFCLKKKKHEHDLT